MTQTATVSVPKFAGGRPRLALFGLCLASALGCIDLTIVTTALAAISADLEVPLTTAQLAMSAFLLALAATMVSAGRLGDRVPRKTLIIAALAVFIVGSIVAALAPNVEVLVVARVLQGVATAVLYTSTTVAAAEIGGSEGTGRAVGILYAANGIGLAAGPVLGGFIISVLDWRWIFWIMVPAAVIAVVALTLGLGGPKSLSASTQSGGERPADADLVGQLLLVLGLGGIVGGFSAIGVVGGSAPVPYVVIALGVAFSAAFLLFEQRRTSPLVDPKLLKSPAYVAALLGDAALAFFYCAALIVLPEWAGATGGLGPGQIGFFMAVITVTMALATPRVGALVDSLGAPKVLPAGMAVLAAAGIGMAVLSNAANPWWMIPALLLFGLGWALSLPSATVAALSAFPENQAGMAVGGSWTAHNLGGALGSAFVGVTLAVRANAEADVLDATVVPLIAVPLVAAVGIYIAGRRQLQGAAA